MLQQTMQEKRLIVPSIVLYMASLVMLGNFQDIERICFRHSSLADKRSGRQKRSQTEILERTSGQDGYRAGANANGVCMKKARQEGDGVRAQEPAQA